MWDFTYLHIEISKKGPWALWALESFDTVVHFDVFVEICFLCERLSASGLSAFVRTITSMDPQVVEEIVPFAEESARRIFLITALGMVALKNFHNALWARVLKAEDTEVLWADRNILLETFTLKIATVPIAYSNFQICRESAKQFASFLQITGNHYGTRAGVFHLDLFLRNFRILCHVYVVIAISFVT